MGLFIWKCMKCERSIKSPYNIPAARRKCCGLFIQYQGFFYDDPSDEEMMENN